MLADGRDDISRGKRRHTRSFRKSLRTASCPAARAFSLQSRRLLYFLAPSAVDPFPLGMVKGCVIHGRLLDHSWFRHRIGNKRVKVKVRHVALPSDVAEVKLCEARVGRASSLIALVFQWILRTNIPCRPLAHEPRLVARSLIICKLLLGVGQD